MGIKYFLSGLSVFFLFAPTVLANPYLGMYRGAEPPRVKENQLGTQPQSSSGDSPLTSVSDGMETNPLVKQPPENLFSWDADKSFLESKITNNYYPLENFQISPTELQQTQFLEPSNLVNQAVELSLPAAVADDSPLVIPRPVTADLAAHRDVEVSQGDHVEISQIPTLQLPSEEPIAPSADPDPPDDANQNSLDQNGDISPTAPMLQVTPLSQLSDVQSADWAFRALQSLVDRYNCIAGYPDGTFGGNRSLTRYEFAAGLNACLENLQKISTGNEDLLTLQRLQEEFSAELATLRSRVEAIEARTTTVRDNQFSSTVSLAGQVILGLSTASGGDPPGRGENHPILNQLTQLQIGGSFTGRDLLRIGLTTGNFENQGFANFQSLNTNMSLLSYQTDLDNQIRLTSLEYRFAAFNDRVVFTLKPVGFSLDSILSPNSAYAETGQGAISRFAELNPVFRIGNLDAGLGLDWLVSNKVRLQFAYGTRNSDDPEDGLLAADHNTLGIQLLLKPNPNLIAGITYVNGYTDDGRLDTFTGSNNADISGGFNEPARIHALSTTLQWRLTSNITFGAWGGLILTDSTFGEFIDVILSGDGELEDLGAITLSTTYLFSLGLSDPFGRKGDLLGLMVGQPPKLSAGVLIEDVDDGNSTHYEVFYRFRLNDHITITPGFFIVTDPGHISRNNDIFVGTIRTTISF